MAIVSMGSSCWRPDRSRLGLSASRSGDAHHRRPADALAQGRCDIAWRTQLRLSAKYRRLAARHVNQNKIVVALARELSGFVWAVGQKISPQ